MNPSIHPIHPTRPVTARKTTSFKSALRLIRRCFHIFVKVMRGVREAVRFFLLMIKMLFYAVILFLVVAGLYILLNKPVSQTGRHRHHGQQPAQPTDTGSHDSRSTIGDSALIRWTLGTYPQNGSINTALGGDSPINP